MKVNRDGLGARDMSTAARRLRPRLAGTTLRRTEIEDVVGKRPAAGVGHWLHMVRVPPSGTWERRRADLYALAEDWLGPAEMADDDVDRSRRAPVPRRLRSGHARRARQLGGLAPRRGGPRAGAPAAAPLRLRGRRASWSTCRARRCPTPRRRRPSAAGARGTRSRSPTRAARRSSPSATETRVFRVRMPQSVPTFLVDGTVAGTWRHEDGRVAFDPFERLDRATLRALREEGERMAALHA